VSRELHELLSRDHQRLDALLSACLRDDGSIDGTSYDAFRRGLLRHIGIEERLLFPAIRKQQETRLLNGNSIDHAALAALLVPPPTSDEINAIRSILAEHNPLEENPGGFYDVLEENEELIEAVRRFPAVPVAPFSDTLLLRSTIEQLLRQRHRSE